MLENPEPGAYEVILEYACDPESAGVDFEIVTRGGVLESKVVATAGWDDFQERLLGDLELKSAERVIVSMKPVQDPPLALMNLRSIRLVPIID